VISLVTVEIARGEAGQAEQGISVVGLTDYHAKYFAHELTKRCASDSVEKLAGALRMPKSMGVKKFQTV
jgi:hypothetical protein